jgi:ACS family hexuronate transporter-like MFS transporter
MRIKNFRWVIVGLIAIVTAINYLDRQNFPVALSEIRKTIAISDVEYGIVNSLFLFAYGATYAIGGRLLDVLGCRLGYTILVIWWSLANLLHGLVSSLLGIGIARFLLGAGEGGAFPGSAKVVSEWFPAKERAFAFGLFNTGSSLGAALAPPLIAFIIAFSNWRWTFIITGFFGLAWVVCWWRIYSLPSKSRFLTEDERELITEKTIIVKEGADNISESISVANLLTFRKTWGLMAIKFLTDAGWYFFIFWLPKYMNDVRGLAIAQIGAYAWIPYAFAGAGSFLSGWLSNYLIKKNVSLDLARKVPLGIAAAMLPVSLLIANASLNMAIVFFSISMLGHQAWSTIVQTLVADMYPAKVVGTVAGLAGCAGTYGGMLFSLLVSFIISGYGYRPAFFIAGILHPLSFLLIIIIIKKIELVNIGTRQIKKIETVL